MDSGVGRWKVQVSFPDILWPVLSVNSFRAIEILNNAQVEDESSDGGEASEEGENDDEDRRDELELSLVDLTPQFESLFTNA